MAHTRENTNAHRVLVWKSEGMNNVQDLREKGGIY